MATYTDQPWRDTIGPWTLNLNLRQFLLKRTAQLLGVHLNAGRFLFGWEGAVSIRIMSAVWEEADVGGARLLVLLALADYANDNGICWPGVNALARKARVSERYVRELLGDLESNGHIIRELNTGPYGVNTYKVLVGGAKLAGCEPIPLGGYDN